MKDHVMDAVMKQHYNLYCMYGYELINRELIAINYFRKKAALVCMCMCKHTQSTAHNQTSLGYIGTQKQNQPLSHY